MHGMLDADDIVIDRICNGLMDREDIWWSRLICPGPWESVLGADASDFIKRWIAADRARFRPPFAVLYPPLGLRRLKFNFARITLWQVAVDLQFNIGVVDLIELPGLRPSSERRALRSDFLAQMKAFGDQPEPAAPKLEKADHTKDVPTDTPPATEPDDDPEDFILEYLLELTEADLSGLKKVSGMSPERIQRRIKRDGMVLECAEDAVRWTALLLSLSRRRTGRSCVIDPNDPLTMLPNGPHDISIDLSALPFNPPEAVQIDPGWRVQSDVWLGVAIWRITATVSTDGDVQVDRTERLADAPENPPEAQVGPVRLFDYPGEKNTV